MIYLILSHCDISLIIFVALQQKWQMFPKRIHNQRTPTELIQTLLQRRMAASEHKHHSLQNSDTILFIQIKYLL